MSAKWKTIKKFEDIKYETGIGDAEGIAKITINRPEVKNALSDRCIQELIEVTEKLADDRSVRAVILTGAGKVFCSGIDLSHLRQLVNFDEEQNRRDGQQLIDLFMAIRMSPKPGIAAIDGAAVAG